MSANLAKIYRVHGQCSAVIILCCLVVQVFLDLPPPEKIQHVTKD